jgi:hypothetical protein
MRPIRPMRPTAALAIFCLFAPFAACSDREEAVNEPQEMEASSAVGLEVELQDPPAAVGAMAPELSLAAGGGVWMSWLERTSGGHRLRVARFAEGGWGEAVTVAEGDSFFANWADVPSVVEGAEGELLAHWLARLGEGTYAYGVFLARSTDGGASWQELGTLHDDRSATEHGFASLLARPQGGFEAFWLDGRAMAEGGAMTVRAARVVDGAVRHERVLDDRVCECCQTSAARAGDDTLVVYRDRSEEEVRDIARLHADAGLSAPRLVAADGWQIAGCPVNGPAVAAAAERAVVAWFTAADDRPLVQAAFSGDGGASFAAPVEIDAEGPLGRVDVALLADGDAMVSWLGGDGGVWLRRVPLGGPAGPPVRAAATSTARASGFPRLEAADGRLYLAWTEPGGVAGDGRVRFASLPAAEVPGAGG